MDCARVARPRGAPAMTRDFLLTRVLARERSGLVGAHRLARLFANGGNPRPGGIASGRVCLDLRFGLLPLPAQRPDDQRIDNPHDLVAVGVVGAELAALVGIEPALEQSAENRGIDLRPIEAGGAQGQVEFRLLQRQCGIVVEQAAVEPCHLLEADQAAGLHGAKQVFGHRREIVGPLDRLLQHAGEEVARQQSDVLGEHAEHQPVDKVSDRLRVMAALAQPLRDHREVRGHRLGQALSRLARLEALGLGERRP